MLAQAFHGILEGRDIWRFREPAGEMGLLKLYPVISRLWLPEDEGRIGCLEQQSGYLKPFRMKSAPLPSLSVPHHRASEPTHETVEQSPLGLEVVATAYVALSFRT
jgi:hypothetical protein